MSKKCARCEKTVYPLEELKCLDKTWHKGCFKCQECAMTLSMKTYKGFNKLPYCEAHIPKAKATTVAETPESRRLAENTKIQSNVQYHADFEKNKAKFTQVADDPETQRLKKNTKIISNVSYHGTLEQKADMERKRTDDENGTTEQRYSSWHDEGESNAAPGHPPQQNSPQHHQHPGKPSPPHHAPGSQNSPPQQYYSSSDSDAPSKGRAHYYEEEGVEDGYPGGIEHEYNNAHGHPQQGYHNHNQQNYSSSPPGHGALQQQGVVIRASSGGVAVRGGSVGGGGSQGSNRSSSELSSHGHYPPNTNRHSQGSYPQYTSTTNNQYAMESGGGHRVGSIADYDPLNEQYGSIAPKQNNHHNTAGGGYRQQQTYQVQRSNLYGDSGQGQQQQVAAPPQQVNSNVAPQQHKVNAPPTQLGRCYRAMYDYEAADTDEVSFRDGDLIVNCTPIDEGWMTGQVQRSGQTGMLPANYVERVS